MKKTLESYLAEHSALQFILEVTKREAGKPVEYKIFAYGLPDTPFEGKLEPEKD